MGQNMICHKEVPILYVMLYVARTYRIHNKPKQTTVAIFTTLTPFWYDAPAGGSTLAWAVPMVTTPTIASGQGPRTWSTDSAAVI